MGRRTAKGQSGLGKTIMRDKKSSGIHLRKDGLVNYQPPATVDALVSVTDQTSLEDFLTTADLAGRDFTAERHKNSAKIINPACAVECDASEDMLRKQEKLADMVRIPRRPPWDTTTTPDELEAAERESFLDWRRGLALMQEQYDVLVTPYERNLEIWRQLWRVIERSHLVVQIVDARNPLLFHCEDIDRYVKETDSNKVNLLLLNKADLLTERQRRSWAEYFSSQRINFAFWSASTEMDLVASPASDTDSDTDSSEGPDSPGYELVSGSRFNYRDVEGFADDLPGVVDEGVEENDNYNGGTKSMGAHKLVHVQQSPNSCSSSSHSSSSSSRSSSARSSPFQPPSPTPDYTPHDCLPLVTITSDQLSLIDPHRPDGSDDDYYRDFEELSDYGYQPLPDNDDDVDSADDMESNVDKAMEEPKAFEAFSNDMEVNEVALEVLGVEAMVELAEVVNEVETTGVVDEEDVVTRYSVISPDVHAIFDTSSAGSVGDVNQGAMGDMDEVVDEEVMENSSGESDTNDLSYKVLSGDELLRLFRRLGSDVPRTGSDVPRSGSETPTRLTVGLLGYPNVGKSSTINALIASKKVAVSATPGRTKHLQTLYVSDDLVLADCPGLVFPSFVSTKAELILNGVLSVDQMRDYVAPVALLCQRVPRPVLAGLYGFRLAEGSESNRIPDVRPATVVSMTHEFLDAHATSRGFMTSRGRPDGQRSARLVLKDYVQARIVYCHAPPGVPTRVFQDWMKSRVSLGNTVTSSPPPTKEPQLSQFDSQFFSGQQSRLGVKGNRVPGAMTTGRKRHNNKCKKEKLRRVYKHLDQ